MTESPCDYLKRFLSDVDGILGLFVADKDGVVMASASSDDIPDQALLSYIFTTFICSIQQANKMELGKMKWMVTRYREMVICQFNFNPPRSAFPLILTVVGSSDCDVGAIIALEPSLHPLLNRLAPEAASRIQKEVMMSRTSAGPYYRV